MATDGLSQEAQRDFTIPSGYQQEVHRSARLVDRAVQIFPCAFDPHIGRVQSLVAAHWMLACQERLLQSQRVFEDPTIRAALYRLRCLRLSASPGIGVRFQRFSDWAAFGSKNQIESLRVRKAGPIIRAKMGFFLNLLLYARPKFLKCTRMDC
jgi:hypothetical protein